MRTAKEINERIKAIEKQDFFGFETSDLIAALTYKDAKKHLKDGTTKKQWDKGRAKYSKNFAKDEILDYLPFAWMKANDCRGLSAARSLNHLCAWLFLHDTVDAENLIKEIESGYCFYGKPHLIKVSEMFGFNWKKHDNGERKNTDG